jgi:hypothetical protein
MKKRQLVIGRRDSEVMLGLRLTSANRVCSMEKRLPITRVIFVSASDIRGLTLYQKMRGFWCIGKPFFLHRQQLRSH